MPWEIVSNNSEVLAIHAALLSTDAGPMILYFGGDEHNPAQNRSGNPADIDNTRLFHVPTGDIIRIGSPTTDVFCSGHAFLGDGRLLVGGGTETFPQDTPDPHNHPLNFGGHSACWVYIPDDRSWMRVGRMHPEPGQEETGRGGGRWYPTLLTLTNGDVLAVFGHPSGSDTRHRNNTPERFSQDYLGWTLLPSIAEAEAIPYADNPLNYPRLHLIPSGDYAGKIFFSTPVGKNRIYDPTSGTFVGPAIEPPTESTYLEWYGTSVLLPLLPPGPTSGSEGAYVPRVLACGGVQPLYINLPLKPLKTGDVPPQWVPAGARTGAAAGRVRENLCAVLLPTAEVLVTGGVGPSGLDDDAVLQAEIYKPEIDWNTMTYTGNHAWRTVESASVKRNYHSVALLMPDGSVWTAGSSKNSKSGDPAAVGEMRIEVYRPPYVDDPARPEIRFPPPIIGYGNTFDILTPQANSIQRVAFIRAGSVTHAFDADQRYVGLSIRSRTTDRLVIAEPPNHNVAPPGWYLLFIVNENNIPSVGHLVRLRYSTLQRVKVEIWPLEPGVHEQPETEKVFEPADFGNIELDLGTLRLGESRLADIIFENSRRGRLDVSDTVLSDEFSETNTRLEFYQGSRIEPTKASADPSSLGGFPEVVGLAVLFSPNRHGTYNGTLSVKTNSVNAPTLQIKLRGQGSGPKLEASPNHLSFGDVEVGKAFRRTITVRNVGDREALVSELSKSSETPANQFHLGSVVSTIPPGESRGIDITYIPTTVAPAEAVLKLRYRGDWILYQESEITLAGTGVGPVVSLTPPSLTFAAQLLRTTSAPQTVTLANIGTAPLIITNINAKWLDFIEASSCPTNLGTGQSCDIAVRFSPEKAGPLPGILTIESNAEGSPHTVGLTGFGLVGPIVALDPTGLSFGDQPTGTTGAPQAVTHTNDGTAVLQVTGVTLSGPNAGDFIVTNDTCSGATVPPEDKCITNVRFNPSATGGRQAELEFTDNADGSPHKVALSGTGTTAPVHTLNPTSLAFGNQAFSTSSAPQTVTLTNNGSTPLTVQNVGVTGQDVGDFMVTAETCRGVTVAPGSTCTIDVAFAPAAIGSRSADLTFNVTENATTSQLRVPLAGIGLGPTVSFNPTSLVFPATRVGNPSTELQNLELHNTGNAPLTISSITFSSDDFKAFPLALPAGLPPGKSLWIRVRFIPTAVGVRTGELTIVDNAADSPHRVLLSGEGVPPPATLNVTNLAFGNQPVGSTSVANTVTVTITGSEPVEITSVSLTGANSGDFVKGMDSCTGSTIQPGNTCTVEVRFAPTAVGSRSAQLFFITSRGALITSLTGSGS